MKLRKRTVILLMLPLLLIVAALVFIRVPPDQEVEGHRFFFVYGEPFLVPDPYVYDSIIWERDNLAYFRFNTSLPGLGPNGHDAAQDWANGTPLLVTAWVTTIESIIHDPEDRTLGLTSPEWYTQNQIDSKEWERETYPGTPISKVPLRERWRDFVAQNRHRDGVVFDVSDIFGWHHTYSSPDEDIDTHHIAFADGRVALLMRCDQPEPKTSPHCSGNYNPPGDPFEISVLFNREELPQAMEIIEGMRALLERFNQAGRTHLKNHPSPPD